jgi:cyclopropane fatty-acyl-phospholipid synthase-like methyltransferase
MLASEEELRPLLRKMHDDWDVRARANALFYVNCAQQAWSDEDFFRTGELNIAEQILTDMENVCQGARPKEMRVLEIGCGAGRLTRSLANVFGEVHAVDVSPEMIGLAKKKLADFPNVFLYTNNGLDLAPLPDVPFDFAFSFIVFQHIPSREVIASYVREVHRLLRPGALFKLQVQGCCDLRTTPDDTWLGFAFSPEEVSALAAECGFECRYRVGAGTQYFWAWFFKM